MRKLSGVVMVALVLALAGCTSSTAPAVTRAAKAAAAAAVRAESAAKAAAAAAQRAEAAAEAAARGGSGNVARRILYGITARSGPWARRRGHGPCRSSGQLQEHLDHDLHA